MTNPKKFNPDTIADMVGEENVSVMLGHFLDAGYPWLEEFKSEWSSQNTQQLKLLAHKMKSSSRIIGATELADQLEYIEKNVQQDIGLIQNQDIYDALTKHFSAVIEEINDYLD